MKARVWSSGWSRPTGETSPWTLGRRRPREVRRFQRGASASADGGAPVAGEARLIADVEPLAEQTHPLDAPGSLQLSQAPVAGFPFVHLQKPPPPTKSSPLGLGRETSSAVKGPDLVADDLPLHGHAEAGERAVADRARGHALATLRLPQLVGLGLPAVQRLGEEEADVAVPAGDDRQQLLLQHQVNVMHLLVVSHPDDFWGGGERGADS